MKVKVNKEDGSKQELPTLAEIDSETADVFL